MILIIDTIDRYKLKLGIGDQELEIKEIETQDQSMDLLPAIKNYLLDRKLNPTDLSAVLVNQGPGSFTGVRVGVTTANTLAWSLNIPVYGYKDGELEKVFEEIANTGQKTFSKPVLPLYPEN